MASPEKFTMLRILLRAFGLSDAAIEDIIDRILEFLVGKERKPMPLAEIDPISFLATFKRGLTAGTFNFDVLLTSLRALACV